MSLLQTQGRIAFHKFLLVQTKPKTNTAAEAHSSQLAPRYHHMTLRLGHLLDTSHSEYANVLEGFAA